VDRPPREQDVRTVIRINIGPLNRKMNEAIFLSISFLSLLE
jgi:hypothetical protein